MNSRRELRKLWEGLDLKYKLRDLLIEKGYIRGPFGSALKRGEMESEGIPVYEQKNAINNHRQFRYYINEKKFEELKRFATKENDLIISCSGTVGKISIIKSDDPIGIISQALLILRPDEKVVRPRFLYYFFQSKEGQNALLSRSSGSVQVNIAKRKIIEDIDIDVPEIEEQDKVINILDSISAKIETNNQTIKSLEEIASTLFKRWFVDFEFPNENGNPYKSNGGKMIEREEEKIPKGWDITILEEYIEVKYGKDHKKLSEGPYPVYGSGGVMRYVDKFLYTKESVLIPRKGTLNNVMYIQEPFWSVDTMFYSIMKKESIGKFIYLFLEKIDLKSMNVGSAVPSMTTNILNNMKIIKPPTICLIQFNLLVTPIFEKKSQLKNENNTLEQIRDTLLPKLLSGEIELPIDEEDDFE